ncbi:MAG: hypothetical protein R3359_09380, partial [Marinirhabdus sp.]|nr:hypothetical protein [Marinirhabdus sp.]
TTKWHEAFYIAQQLYEIPKAFSFPNPMGKDEEIIANSKKPEQLWESDLHIERKENTLQLIKYSQRSEGFGSSVTISKAGDLMKIEYRTVAD